jgi:hypothetical protein
MHNPSHPGEILREFFPEGMTVEKFAQHFGVSRVQLSLFWCRGSGASVRFKDHSGYALLSNTNGGDFRRAGNEHKSWGKGNMTNHEMIKSALTGFGEKTLTSAQIKSIVLEAYPVIVTGSVLPNNHATDSKGACLCAATPKRIFDRLAKGVYRVRG